MATKKILIKITVSEQQASAALDKVTKAVDGLSSAQVKNTNVGKQGRAQSGLNNAILLETGRLASDAAYGFNGIANNLSQVISLMQSYARTEGGFVKSIKKLLKSIWGTGGLLIAIQLLISFGPKLIKMFKGAATAADLEREAIEKLNKALDENLRLRARNAKRAKSFINIFTKDFEDMINLIDIGSIKAEARLFEISEQFIKFGMAKAKILKDESVSQGDRVRIAVKLLQIYNKETEILKIRRKLETIDPAKIDQISMLKMELIKVRTEIFGIEKEVDRISGKAVVVSVKVEPEEGGLLSAEKVKSWVDLTKTEWDSLFIYLEDRAKDSSFIIEKLLEGWTMAQIEMSLKATEMLKGAGDVGIQTLEDLVDADNKLAKTKKDNAKAQKKLDNAARTARNKQLNEISKSLSTAASLFGENTSANKSMKIASAIISTYAGANEALAGPVPLNYINAAAIIAAGFANVKKIKDVKVPNDSSSSVGSAPSIQAPDFNVVGAGGVSQLATGLAGITGKPIQAFVVSKEISSAQELDRNITSTAALG